MFIRSQLVLSLMTFTHFVKALSPQGKDVYMSNIKVTEAHGTDADKAIQLIESFEEMMKKYGVKVNWSGHQAEIKGLGVSGQILVDSTDVTVSLKLGMMARAAGVDGQRLEASIRKRLVAAFQGD